MKRNGKHMYLEVYYKLGKLLEKLGRSEMKMKWVESGVLMWRREFKS
jgi:hypothetical protein